MSRIATILSFVRSTINNAAVTDVSIDVGGGDNKTAQHFSTPGDDSHPLTSDYAVISDVSGNGRKASHGYLDPKNTPFAQEGEKRIYARDKTSGDPVNQVWLKNDGSVLISNDNGSVLLRPDGGVLTTTPNSTFDAATDGSIKGVNGLGSFELQAAGDFVVNGVTIKVDGSVIIPSSLDLNGKEIADHDHSQGSDSNGDTQVDTGANN